MPCACSQPLPSWDTWDNSPVYESVLIQSHSSFQFNFLMIYFLMFIKVIHNHNIRFRRKNIKSEIKVFLIPWHREIHSQYLNALSSAFFGVNIYISRDSLQQFGIMLYIKSWSLSSCPHAIKNNKKFFRIYLMTTLFICENFGEPFSSFLEILVVCSLSKLQLIGKKVVCSCTFVISVFRIEY